MKTFFADLSKGHFLVLATWYAHNFKTRTNLDHFCIKMRNQMLCSLLKKYYAAKVSKSQKVSMRLISGGRVTYGTYENESWWKRTGIDIQKLCLKRWVFKACLNGVCGHNGGDCMADYSRQRDRRVKMICPQMLLNLNEEFWVGVCQRKSEVLWRGCTDGEVQTDIVVRRLW